MNPLSVIILAIVQGLTEFLPVSSSGHLVILQNLLPGFFEPGILLEVVLHAGTLVAVLFFFRQRLGSFLKIRFLWLLFIGTLPAVAVGLLLKNQIEILFQSVRTVGAALIVSGIINFLVDKFRIKDLNLRSKSAFVIGLAQALAIIPGLSRSASTILAATAQGVNKKEAVEFSFLLSVPAVFGAAVLELWSSNLVAVIDWPIYLVGFLTAVVFGYLAIVLVFRFIAKSNFKYFAYYCCLLGLAVLVLF